VEQGTLAVQLQTAPQRFHSIQYKPFRVMSVPFMPETPKGLGVTPAAEAGPNLPLSFLIIWIMIVHFTSTAAHKADRGAAELALQILEPMRHWETEHFQLGVTPAAQAAAEARLRGWTATQPKGSVAPAHTLILVGVLQP
jgi:hypothetical protein